MLFWGINIGSAVLGIAIGAVACYLCVRFIRGTGNTKKKGK